MNRLFWKLFFSFWVALVLFAGAVVYSASQYIDRIRTSTAASSPEEMREHIVTSAQAAADNGGIEALREWARKVDDHELVPLLVVDTAGQDVLDRDVPPRAMNHLRRHRGGPRGLDDRRPSERPPPDRGPARTVSLPDGQEFWIIPDFKSVTLGRFLGRPRVIAVPLLAAALAGALVCLLLARYLAAPIARLRRATQAYAGGDFSHRVGPTLGRRRDEIVDLAFALDHMAERLDTLMRAQRLLLRDVSHELRSPLARVQAALGLARQRGGGAVEAELDRIEHETERLNELIAQILSVSRLDADGDVALHVEPIPMDELLQELVEDATLEAQARDCSVRLDAPEALQIEGDPALLHSAVENVLRNAIRHTAANTEVAVTLEAAADGKPGCTIRVADRGPGVAPEMLDQIFQPFVRVGDARDRNSGGHGLGLAIAERAIRGHGGTIHAENRPGGGLVVVIRLPERSAKAT
jgi:two-component system, OmpR family, sensor histidine kinase CpxA